MIWRLATARPGPDGAPSFESVVLPHLDAACSLARWLVGDATLAEDVVQDASVRALRHFATYRGGDARAWFLRIVRNAAHEARTTRRRHQADSLDRAPSGDDAAAPPEIQDSGADPEAALACRQRHAALADALAALPMDLRECLVLRELEELSYREIAQVTGVPVGTVMSRLWRARQKLSPALADVRPEGRGA